MKRFLVALFGIALSVAATVLADERFTPALRSIKLAVDDMDRTVVFYTALGMKTGPRHGTVLEMIWDNGSKNSGLVLAPPDYPGRKGMVRGGTYLMFVTPDVGSALDRLRDAGFQSLPEPRAMGDMVTVVMLRDPEGNQIELMGPPPGK